MTAGGPQDRQRSPSWWARLRARFQPRRPQPPVSRDLPQPVVDLLAPSTWEEREAWRCFRPRTLAECVGQQAIVETLKIAIQACKERGEPLEHVLFHGPPGLGKTTFACIIANELGVQFRGTSGSALEHSGDLVSILTGLEEGDVLCIEAAHHLPVDVADMLCQAMSDYMVDIAFEGAHAHVYRLRLPRFTVVGTTTRIGFVPRRLRENFGLCLAVSFYTAGELTQLLRRSAALLDLDVEDAAVRMIAERSRGTPRVANRLLRRVRDYAQVRGLGHVACDTAIGALLLDGVDGLGLTPWDRSILAELVEVYRGGPVSTRTLLAPLKHEGRALADAMEPYLFSCGLIAGTPRGIVATEKAYQHLRSAAP